MKKLIWAIFAAVVVFNCPLAHADSVTANITADNAFSYWDGSTWVAAGNNWQIPGSYAINHVGSPDMVYIAVQNYTGDSGNPAALLASFTDPTGTFTQTGTHTLLSNSSVAWQVFVQPTATWISNPFLDPTTLIGGVTPTSYGANSDTSTIWNEVNGGPISGIDPNAEWIWTANNDQNYDSPGQDNFAIFSADLSVNSPLVTPEPPTFLLFAFAAAMIVLLMRRKLALV